MNDILILELDGKLEDDYKLYETQIQELIKNENKVILDCEKLLYINSLGLRVLLRIFKQLLQKQGKLIFCKLNQNVKDVFLITGFMQLFEIYKTIDEAIQHLNK